MGRNFPRNFNNKFGLSPIFATVMLAVIIIFAGSLAFYFSTNLTTTATNQYADAISDTQQSLSERVGFENVVYTSSPLKLEVYVINCGLANNLQIDIVFIYDSSHRIVREPYSGSQISSLYQIDTGIPITDNHLNIGDEGYFYVNLSGSLTQGSLYTLHLITKNGSSFDYDFVP
jgi:hypothetical protein